MYYTNGQVPASQPNGQAQAAPPQQAAPQVPQHPAPAPAPAMPQQPAPQAMPQGMPVGGGYDGPQQPQGFNWGGGNEPPPQPAVYGQQPQQQPPQQPAAPQPGQQPQPNDPIFAALRQYGYDPSKFSSSEELMRSIADAGRNLERLPQLEALAQVGARTLQQQGQQPSGQQPAQPGQQQGEQPEWSPPEYDPQWERFLEIDETTGRFRPADPALIHYAEAANRYRDWQASEARKLWSNPYAYMWTGLKPRIEKDFISPFEQRIKQLEQVIENQQLADAIAPHEHVLYQRDQNGQPDYDRLSQAGQVFDQAYRYSAQFQANGRPLSVEERVRYAMAQIPQQAAAPQQQPQQYNQPAPYAGYQQPAPQAPAYQPPVPQQTQQPQFPMAPAPQYQPPMQPTAGADQQDAFINRALERARQAPPQPYQHQPGMAGNLVHSAEQGIAQNPTQSFEAMAHQTARELGISL